MNDRLSLLMYRSMAYSFAGLMNAGMIISNGAPFGKTTKVMVAILVLFSWAVLNFVRVDQVGFLNIFAAVAHVFTIFLIVLVVLTLPPYLNTPEFVFTQYTEVDDTHTSPAYNTAIGLLFACFCYTGYESAGHMAEETSNAAVNAPRAMIMTNIATAVGGLVLITALLFATTDVSQSLAGTDDSYGNTGYALINMFVANLPIEWAIALTWLVLLNLFFAGVSSVAVTGRITFALMRDRAMPYGEFFSRVHPTLHSPINSLLFVFAFDFLLLLLPLSSNGEVAFYAILGLSVLGFQVSYAIPIALKVIYNPQYFPKTAFNLGIFSAPLGIISTIWLLYTSFLFFLPIKFPITIDNMNWLIVVFSVVFSLFASNWVFNSRHHFTGPRRMSDMQYTQII
jgi:amino acid transporter